MIEELIVKLAEARFRFGLLKEEVQEAKERWELENAELLAELLEAQKALEEAEKEVRERAIEVFRATGDKKVHPAVEVVEKTELSYDEDEAKRYVLEHRLEFAVKLDKIAFGKFAKNSPLPFVIVKVEPQARIATDLSGYSPLVRDDCGCVWDRRSGAREIECGLHRDEDIRRETDAWR